MTEFGQEGHPCRGKDCKDCETCIFDEDLFLDKVKPNKRENIMSSKLCNFCANLEKSFEHREPGRFDAACRAVMYDTWNSSRPRRIDYNLSQTQDIVRPTWCPLNNNKKNPSYVFGEMTTKKIEKEVKSLPAVPTTPPKPIPTEAEVLEELRKKPVESLTYSERRTLMKDLPKHLKWDEIEEGKTYVIPKIMSQGRKIVKVSSKTSGVCVCHEINETTGNEYSYTCNIYPSDLDAVFITELREF
jgi:hypothetical protein